MTIDVFPAEAVRVALRISWLLLSVAALGRPAAEGAALDDVQKALTREIVGPVLPLAEVQRYVESRVPRLNSYATATAWEAESQRLRQAVLERVVYRGEAIGWRDAPARVEWLESIPGGPGYHIRKLRYEALPGLWIPALLYEPETIRGRVPAILNVNGHVGKAGKAIDYKQIRCINQAKRGMLALNVEWLGMGQLLTEGFRHGRMNQLDLCGTSGVAPFYLSLRRGLDLLVSLPQADPQRVAVTGLSGGGWQTIFVSALDGRVTLAVPVAGYSSFGTRAEHAQDMGDSEQLPCDLGSVVDYLHLTAMRAPRPTLLIYNAKDNCCFQSGYALQPLLDGARPVFRLFGREDALRWHVNNDPGTHNYDLDNRQALYRALGDFFYPGDRRFDSREIDSKDEVKSREELAVALPAGNEDLHSLAAALAERLPRHPELPRDAASAAAWQAAARARLRDLLREKTFEVQAVRDDSRQAEGLSIAWWRLQIGGNWTVPAVELTPPHFQTTVIVLADGGRRAASAEILWFLSRNDRVIAVDPFGLGESAMKRYGPVWNLFVAALGDRPLGIQCGQVAAVARWARSQRRDGRVAVMGMGPRTSVIAIITAALEEKAIDRVEMQEPLGSLRQIIEEKWLVDRAPELFCFGLLQEFDLRQIAALVAPRSLVTTRGSERAKAEFGGLAPWWKSLGGTLGPWQ